MTTNLNLPHWPLPLGDKPYDFEHASVSTVSNTEAFATGIERRDQLLDQNICIICGDGEDLEHCHIIPKVEDKTWQDLLQRAWIPTTSRSVKHESRNGIFMCATHHVNFDRHRFYIRYFEQYRKFVMVNHSRHPMLEQYHGKAVLLDPDNTRVPFYTLFIIHEIRVRGRWPFMGDRAISSPVSDADWITQRLNQQPVQGLPPSLAPPLQGPDGSTLLPASAPGGSSDSGLVSYMTGPSGEQYIVFTNPFNSPAALEKEVKALRQTSTWKACIIENTSWEGTGTENISRYLSAVDTED